MKKYDFLQDFCKKAQWRAKKLRERGSSTARPTEKCVGGLPIGSRFGRFGRVDSVASVASVVPIRAISSRFADFLLAFRPDSVASIRSRRFGRVDSVAIWRAGRADLERCLCRVASKPEARTQKKPDSSIGESGSAIARRRALLTFCKFLFQILVQALEAFG